MSGNLIPPLMTILEKNVNHVSYSLLATQWHIVQIIPDGPADPRLRQIQQAR